MKSMCHSCSTKRQTSLLVAILDYSSFFRASTYTPYESSAKYAFHCRQTWLSLFSFINSKPLDETFSGSLWRNGALHEIACLTIGNLVSVEMSSMHTKLILTILILEQWDSEVRSPVKEIIRPLPILGTGWSFLLGRKPVRQSAEDVTCNNRTFACSCSYPHADRVRFSRHLVSWFKRKTN